MGKFLDIQPVKTDLRNNLNKLITRSEIESVMEKPPCKKSAILDGFPGEVYQTYKETLIPSLLRLFQDTEEEQTLPNSFYEGKITLIPKQRHTKKEKRKLQANIYDEYTCKIPQQNISKPSPKRHKKDHIP